MPRVFRAQKKNSSKRRLVIQSRLILPFYPVQRPGFRPFDLFTCFCTCARTRYVCLQSCPAEFNLATHPVFALVCRPPVSSVGSAPRSRAARRGTSGTGAFSFVFRLLFFGTGRGVSPPLSPRPV